MAFYNFSNPFKRKEKKQNKKETRPLDLPQLMSELGVRTSTVIGTYNQEENPDIKSPDTYISMQENDGTVRSIVRILTMPIVATPIKVVPGENDKGEAEFIKSVFLGSQHEGGMSTSLPFVISDMCRAISEGFRLFEKIPHIIEKGKWKGNLGWKKLAPRDSTTITLRSDNHGGFNGARQVATFGTNVVSVTLPPEKCLLYTFQKERHPLYGESILKTAYYHYDKKHKLYYLAHKKAEVDAIGLKILKMVAPNVSSAERTAAETAVGEIGVNTRITVPQGMELEIDRSPSGYSVMDMIDHHDGQIRLSALTQITQMGTSGKYAYTYGKGFQHQSEYLAQVLSSIMKSMTDTLNEWAVAPLINWNFKGSSYPLLQFAPLTDEIQVMLSDIFYTMIKRKDFSLPEEFENKVIDRMSEKLGLEYKVTGKQDALKAFENGKRTMADSLGIPAPITSKEVKSSLLKKYVNLKDKRNLLETFEFLGKDFTLNAIKKTHV